MPPTLADVAKRAGVSIKTASRVINREQRVADATRQRVLTAVDELGYVPNIWAQRLARGQSGLIGLLFYDTTPAYMSIIMNGLMDAGEASSFTVSIHRANTSDPGQVAEIIAMAAQHRVEGFIFTPPCDNSRKLIETLVQMKFPFVLIAPQQRCNDCHAVAPTDERGSFDAARHLIRLGHRRIGLILGPRDHQAGEDRYQGYQRALQESGLEMDQELIREGSWQFEAGLEGARALLTLAHRPTAIMAPNDVVASGVLQAAWERDLNCPRDLSVVGFDDIPLAHQVCPPLTTVRQPIYELATTAMMMLTEQVIPGMPPGKLVELGTELVIRHSTGPSPR